MKIITDFSDYNKFVWEEKKKDIEDWFSKNLDPFLVKRFLEITEDRLNFFFKMYHYETVEEGVVFYVGVYASEREMKALQQEITGCCNVKDSYFSVYCADYITEKEEAFPDELLALED